MTERTVAKQTQMEDDAISLTSTQESEYDPDKEFIVTRILAERVQSGKRQFLILWADYPEEKSTWEPKDHISPEILDAWKERKMREKRGIDEPFDLTSFEARLIRLRREKEVRKKIRKAKRKCLGIPVPTSDSDTPMAGQDDSSSDEAIEENTVDNVPAPRSSKRNSVSPPKQLKRPFRVLVKGSSIRQIEDNSSGSSGAEPRRKSSPQKARDEMDSSSSKPQPGKTKPAQAPTKTRKSSSSSSDIPLREQIRQKLSGSELANQARADLGLNEAEKPDLGRSDQNRPDSSSSSGSQKAQEMNWGVAPEAPSMALEQNSLFMSETSPPVPEKRPRGRPPTRGKSATRGGGSMVHRNVFEAGDAKKARGRKVGTSLLKQAMDPAKDPKTVGNMRLRRKLELQARDMAEAAPDLLALGGLYNPSDMSSLEPVRPSTLRKSSSSGVAVRDQRDPGEEADLDDLFEEKDNLATRAMPPPSSMANQSTHRKICFFWDRSQQDSSYSSCGNGYLCHYLHNYEAGAVVSPPPPGFIETPSRLSDTVTRKQAETDDGSSSASASVPPWRADSSSSQISTHLVCYFWDRAQRDSRHAPCSNVNCSYLHTYETGVNVAPPPPGYPAYKRDQNINRGQPETGQESLSNSKPPTPWPRDSLSSQAPHGSLQSPPSDTTTTSHSAPPAALPRGNDLLSTAISAPPSTTTPAQSNGQQFPKRAVTPTIQPQPKKSRPSWDPYRPNDAICHFHHNSGRCNRGDTCKFLHTNDSRYPIAPSPYEQRKIQGLTTCLDWANGKCFRSGQDCFYLHAHTPAMTSVSDHVRPSVRDPELAGTASPALPTSNEPRKKSVKFLLDDKDDVFAEPETISPAEDARDSRFQGKPKALSREICRFWQRGICHHGSLCWNQHGYGNERNSGAETEDVKMRDRGQDQDRTRRIEPMPFSSNTVPSVPRSEEQADITLDPMVGVETEDQTVHTEDSPTALPITITDDVITPDPAVKVPRKKVSWAEYTRQKELKKLSARAKEVVFGRDELQAVTLDFGDIQHAEDSSWKQEFANIDKITFGQICMAQDFRAQQGFLLRRGIFSGSLLPADAENQEVTKTIEKVGDELVIRSAGLIASLPNFAILLFPASKEEWKYLEASSDYPKEGRLRYFVFQTDFEIDRPQNSEFTGLKLGEPYRKLMVKMIHGLNIEKLLPQAEKNQTPYKFYLLFPSVAAHTSNFLAAWIKECYPHSKIYDSEKEGSWDYFRNSFEIGVVLVHETAAANIHCLPHLFEVLLKKNFVFWCISDRDSPYPLFPSRQYLPDDSSMGRITATRLFPHGCAMLVTPSFLIAEPRRAYDLMKWFLAKYEGSTPGTWKLVCANNISDYILDLAISKASEKEAFEIENRDNPAKDAILNDTGLSFTHCDARNKLYSLLVRLDAKGMLESPIESDESEDSEYNFHEERESPIILADHSIDPDDEPALINWFAAWSMRNLDIFRKFVVVGTGPSSAVRAKRLKEVVVSTLEEEDKSQPGSELHGPEFTNKPESVARSSSTPATNFQSFSIAKKENLGPSGNDRSPVKQNQRKAALDVAARLTALSPNNNFAKSRVSQDKSKSTSPPPTNVQQPREPSRHGIDPSLSTSLLQFCATTGGSANDAATFLDKADHDVRRAIDLYQKENGEQTMDLDLDAQVAHLIATEATRPLRIATAEEDLARARQLYDSSTSFIQSGPISDAPGSTRLPQLDGADDAYSPQYDGANDRPSSSGSTSTTRSGIATGENGQRSVPRSVRADMSVRREIAVRPGFVPTEDIERYVSPGVAASRSASRTASAVNSPAPALTSPAVATQDVDPMELDGGAKTTSTATAEKDGGDTDTGTATGTDGEMVPKKKVQVKKEVKTYSLEATTNWYERYKETNGSGWEHMFVGAHEEAFKKAGIGK